LKKRTKKDSKGDELPGVPDDSIYETPPLIDIYPGTQEDAEDIQDEYDEAFPERKKQ